MQRFRVVVLLSAIAATTAAAQGPERPRRSAGSPAAEMLLSRTGELGLTDAQVVRLAAIARRSEARRSALRLAMDSARTRFEQPGDSVARRQFSDRMRAEMTRAEEQLRTDQRDALAVLNADQQAKAWSMRTPGSERRLGMRGDRRPRGGGGLRGSRGMQGPRVRPGPRIRGERPRPPRRPLENEGTRNGERVN